MRRLGSKDKRARKRRGDRGKKRKTYGGKPCKHNRKKYPKKIGNKKAIKIWVWKIDKMTYDGYKRWSKHLRRKLNTEIWIPQDKNHVYTMPVEEINTKEKIERFMEKRYYPGTFVIKTFSNKKNKYHCTSKKKLRVVVKHSEYGNVAKVVKDYGMYSYWFWKGVKFIKFSFVRGI